ncbi:MAG TPA: glycosyltransferase family 4 protein [Casimicrobiaceae bacterium]
MARVRTSARHWQTRLAASRYDHAFYASPRERFMFDARKSSLLPNVVRSDSALPAPTDDAPTVLCVGTMWYPPNRDGIEWFLECCWPRITERCPDLVLRIVGAAPPLMRAGWERAVRTQAPGPVDDLRSEYARARFTIAPIRFGGGTQIKFLESAAYARACVATRFVVSAFADDFRDGEATLIADDAAEMVEKCVALATDAPKRDAIAARAQQIVAQRYTVERFEASVHEAVQPLLLSPPGPVRRPSGSALRQT